VTSIREFAFEAGSPRIVNIKLFDIQHLY
jgi:hypothetical protein